MNKKLVIIDVSALMRTHYRPLNSRFPLSVQLEEGELNTTHLYGLFSLFRTYGKEVDYIFCYDHKVNFLKDANPDYKKGRVKVSDDYFIGHNLGREVLEKAGFLVLTKEGYEADHLVLQAKEELVDYYDEVNIITNDKDLTIAIDEKTTWVATRKKQPNITMENYEEDLKCPYNSIHLKKALVGDPSDNLKGIKGFGEVSFKKFVVAEELYLKDVKGNERQIIEESENLTEAQKSQALLDLNIIEPQEVPGVRLEFGEIDWGYVLKVLEILEMRSLYEYVQ